jgi:hypothetical protein
MRPNFVSRWWIWAKLGVSQVTTTNDVHVHPAGGSINEHIMIERIRPIHAMSEYTYGGARVQSELRDMGLCVNHKRIERLMKLAHLQGVSRRLANA